MTAVKNSKIKIVIFFLVLSGSFCGYAQTGAIDTNMEIDSSKTSIEKPLPNLKNGLFFLNEDNIGQPNPQSIMYQNSVFRANQLPIFCKIEYLLGLQSHFPVKIRLGDVDYVDNLESK